MCSIGCISLINNTQVNDAQDMDIVMRMYNLVEYSDVYLKTSGILWHYYRNERVLDHNNIDFPANNNSIPFRFKQQITGETGNGCTKDMEIMVPLRYLSNVWRKHEMPGVKECILVTGYCSKSRFRI